MVIFFMRRRVLQIIITFIYLFVLSCCTNKETELRLKINANSNSTIDQSDKIKVKEYLIEYFLTKEISNLDLNLMEVELNKEFNWVNIRVEKTKTSYEAKCYNGKIVPSGKYDTILVTIGEGKGKNFWTLLYPEFFNISFEDDHEIEYRSYFYDLFI